jgi:hypothetical protein
MAEGRDRAAHVRFRFSRAIYLRLSTLRATEHGIMCKGSAARSILSWMPKAGPGRSRTPRCGNCASLSARTPLTILCPAMLSGLPGAISWRRSLARLWLLYSRPYSPPLRLGLRPKPSLSASFSRLGARRLAPPVPPWVDAARIRASTAPDVLARAENYTLDDRTAAQRSADASRAPACALAGQRLIRPRFTFGAKPKRVDLSQAS